MWNDADREDVTLGALECDQHVLRWSYRGDGDRAAALAEACERLEGDVGVQTCGGTLLLWAPARRRRKGRAVRPADAPELLRAARAPRAGPSEGTLDEPSEVRGDGELLNGGVENNTGT